MTSPYFVVAEIHENKLLQAIVCEGRAAAVDLFIKIVDEYGVVPYEHMINEGIFEDDDGYTVQLKQMNHNKS